MLTIGARRISLLICSAIVLHFFWAAMIAVDQASLNANALSILYRYVHEPMALAVILCGSSACAIASLVIRSPTTALMLIPQQLILMASASNSVDAIWLGRFADGVTRSHAFIAADQVYAIILAIGHTLALVSHVLESEGIS